MHPSSPVRFRRFLGRPAGFVAMAVLIGACASPPVPRTTDAQTNETTLHVLMTEPTYHGLDPQASYTYAQWELLRCCLVRSLMTYRGVPGIAGTQFVPDLAAAPPSVSSDGLVWTFRLRRGIHYAPPLAGMEVTAGDVVRALLRAGSPDPGYNPGTVYLPLIEGFGAYADGKADSIAGVSTPDDYTLQVRETRPDASIVHLFAMPFSAPIPQLPDRPDAVLGVADGHPFRSNFESLPTKVGYGPFLVATGPYMYEGAANLNPSSPPEEQIPATGFSPAWFAGGEFHGSITLVRNPSWNVATDPNRPATADRIEVRVAPAGEALFDELTGGSVDVSMGSEVPPGVLRRLRSSESTADRLIEATGSGTTHLAINVAQPPFDDVHVRRALALALDRPPLAASTSDGGTITSHLVPDPMEGSLLSSWNPFASPDDAGNLSAARTEMKASRYASRGRCSAPACKDVLVGIFFGDDRTVHALRAALTSLGISADFRDDLKCAPRQHVALCSIAWAVDYPDPGNVFVAFLWLDSAFGSGPSLVGVPPDDLRRWGYSVPRVPSVDQDYTRCAAELGVRSTMCWARLDQLLVGKVVAVIPFAVDETIRLQGTRVTSYSFDQAFGEPSLDRIVVST
jgi:ABC-type transport system substrate-binding protein